MRPEELDDLKVVDNEARILGEISGIEIDLKTWKVTDIHVRLDEDSITALGYKKPRLLGKVEITLPISIINIISDIVTLNKNHSEIKNILKQRQS